jgi:hypothetical protein
MRTEELIVRLARDAQPVTPLSPPWRRLVTWGSPWLVAVGAVVVIIGPRPDLTAMLGRARFDGEVLLLLGAAWMSAFAALNLAVPGAGRARLLGGLALVAQTAWIAVSVARLVRGGAPLANLLIEPSHAACFWRALALGLPPVIALFVMLWKGVPLEPARAGLSAALAGFALAGIGTQILCPIDSAAHNAIWHVLPVTGLVLLGSVAGSRIFGRAMDAARIGRNF